MSLKGKKPAFVDYMVWPWIERFDFLKAYRNIQFNKSFATKLEKYMENMKALPAVKKIYIAPEKHERFYEAYIRKEVIDEQEFDHGI